VRVRVIFAPIFDAQVRAGDAQVRVDDAQVRVDVCFAALDHAQVRADDAQVRVDVGFAAPVSGCGSGKRFSIMSAQSKSDIPRQRD